MWLSLVHFSCCLLLVSAGVEEVDKATLDVENLLMNTELEKFSGPLCNHDSGGVARCVKKSLCQLAPQPVNYSTDFTFRELEEGNCKYYQTCCPENKIRNEEKMPKIQKPNGCGYSNPGATVLRELADQYGYAEYGEFPWMVALMKKNVPTKNFNDASFGGGVLIDPSVVLTVAHKVEKMSPDQLICRAGEYDTETEDELYLHQDRHVKQIILHNEYNGDMASIRNDVALLILKEPFVLADAPHIGVACLEQRLPPAGTECYSMGWGKDFVKGDKYANILKKVKLPLVDRAKCQDIFYNYRHRVFELHKSFTCAGGVEGVDTCHGDGGSSLVCRVNDKSGLRYSVVGMVAFGINCGSGNLPGVYVNVPEIYRWVTKEMEQQGFKEASSLSSRVSSAAGEDNSDFTLRSFNN